VLGFPPSDCNFFCDNIWQGRTGDTLCRFICWVALMGMRRGGNVARRRWWKRTGFDLEQPDHRSEPPSAGRLTLAFLRYNQPLRPRSPSAIRFFVKFRPPAPRPIRRGCIFNNTAGRFGGWRWHLVPLCVHGSRRPRRSHRNQDSSFECVLRPLVALAYAPNHSPKDSGSPLKEFLACAPFWR